METSLENGQCLQKPKMYENFRFPVETPMIKFYCKNSECDGRFETAYNEKYDIINAGADTCPKCGSKCEPSRFRRIRY